MIDDVTRCVLHILAQWKVDVPGIVFDVVRHQCVVGLLDFAVMELPAQFAMRIRVACQHDHATGVTIQAVDDAGLGMFLLDATDEAVSFFRADSRHRQQAGRLVDYQEAVVVMEYGWQHVQGDRLPRVMMNTTAVSHSCSILLAMAFHAHAHAQDVPETEDWKESEAAWLAEAVQLTFHEQFVKAGEGYFSPDGSMIIFQAVEQTAPGVDPDDFYAMYVADTRRDEEGRTQAITNIRRLSPKGSANTCGWFHPTDPNIVIFGSTISSPKDSDAPGYQRGSNRYRWQFPPGCASLPLI